MALERDGAPLAVQLQEQLRAAIREGRLAAGERLPSTRRLAEQLGVSRGTVVEGFEQLRAEGYLESVVGSGTRVADVPSAGRGRRLAGVCAPRPDPTPEIDFTHGIPDLGAVPLTDWARAIGEATRTCRPPSSAMSTPAGHGTCGTSSAPTTVACEQAARTPATR